MARLLTQSRADRMREVVQGGSFSVLYEGVLYIALPDSLGSLEVPMTTSTVSPSNKDSGSSGSGVPIAAIVAAAGWSPGRVFSFASCFLLIHHWFPAVGAVCIVVIIAVLVLRRQVSGPFDVRVFLACV
jgi:hypothetical protein